MTEKRRVSPRTALITAVVVAIGAAALSCLCGLAALFLLERVDSLPGGIVLRRPNAVQPTATPKSLPPSPPASATAPRVNAQPQGATATPTATQTPRPTHTRSPPAVPTPFVCEELTDLAEMSLAPGQRFECTVQQETLTDLANSYTDSPCNETRFTLDDGEIWVECRRGITMSATLAARAQRCRIILQVLGGTLGFRKVVQELVETQFNAVHYDDICVEQVIVDDGRIFVSGYGR